MSMTGGKAYCVLDKTSTTGNRVRLYIYVKEKSQSTSTNSTTLQLGMYVNSTAAIGPWYKSSDSYIGTATSGSNCHIFNGSISKGSGTRWLVENEEVTVKHNTDGTKSVKIYWKWGINAYTSYISGYQNPSDSKTVSLTPIPQASTIVDADDITLNGSSQTCVVKVDIKSSSFYHKVKITCGSKSTTSSAFTTSSVGVSIPNSWLSELPNSTYKDATVKLFTYTSSACTTRVGSTDSMTIKISAGKDIIPSVSTLTPSVVNGINGYYIKGKSSVKLSVGGAKPGTGSSIDSYIFVGPNISGSSSSYTATRSTKTSSIIQPMGDLSYSVQIKDTRGRLSDKVFKDISVIDYTLPTITSLKVERSDDDKSATVTIKINYKNITVEKTANGAITRIVNAPTLNLTKGSSTVSLNSTNSTISSSTNTSTNIVTVTYKHTYSVNITDKYDIRATLYDEICGDGITDTKTVKLLSASRILNIAQHGNGVGIGQMSTVTTSTAAGKFECAWDSYFNKNIYFDDTAQQVIRFNNASKSKWSVNLYKGTSIDSTTVIGVYDVGNSRPVWKYMNDGNFQIERPLKALDNVFVGKGLLTNDKTGAYDGKQGVCVNDNGRVYVVGDSSDTSTGEPGIIFAFNKSKTGTSSILEKKSGELTLNCNAVITGTLNGFNIPEIQHGRVTITPSAANTPTSKIVRFSKSFSSTPDVTLTPATGGPYTYVRGVGAKDVATDKFNAYLTRTDTSDTILFWIAMN